MTHVRLVTATRMNESEFWRHSYLGRSLRAMPHSLRPKELAIHFGNTEQGALGLPTVYNRAIESAPSDAIVLCVHDDVFIHDPFLVERLRDALDTWEVVGLAGSLGSDPEQPSWGLAFTGPEFDPLGWQHQPGVVLSGAVSHCPPLSSSSGAGHAEEYPPAIELSIYGPPSYRADLLDGVFLAAHARDLRLSNVWFDERFPFHLYDLDFCRQARRAGLELATIALLATHASGGAFCTPSWKAAARVYLEKWSSSASSRSPDLLPTRPLES